VFDLSDPISKNSFEVFTSDHFEIELPAGHRFPIDKYRRLRNHLIETGILNPEQLREAPLADRSSILYAHDPDYVDRFLNNRLSEAEIRRIGFPWSLGLVNKVLASVGGAIAAAQSALDHGVSGNLAGGTHHAHRDWGSGYCVFNDLAIVALKLLGEGLCQRIAIIDLDVHQGDGNASILNGHPHAFVFNMHCESNFPFRKVSSTFDLHLRAGMGDDEYLDLLEKNLFRVFEFEPDLILYQAGVDPLAQDSLGKLELTHAGLFKRDCTVIGESKKRGVPISLALGGGYSNPIEASIQAYLGTYQAVQRFFGSQFRSP
jgi:acetoin utilization deacetylase AcuC-like enzyme